jgi:hypothetical protein
VVINLAVVDDVERAVLVRHRLMSGCHVNDTQPTVAQAHALAYKQAAVIRPAMYEHVAHAYEHALVNALVRPAGQYYSVNSTHNLFIAKT